MVALTDIRSRFPCAFIVILLCTFVTQAAGSLDDIEARARNWWAFAPLVKPKIPGNASASPMDAFLDVKIKSEGLTKSRPAGRTVLFRRVALDLTGLPPDPASLRDFLSDSRPGAFERAVDRLLASPAYGQRWARHWLDVVRYADYHDADPKSRTASCEPLEAWRYRDWVVDALNRDEPFDRFIRLQIAGDLLPDPQGGSFYGEGLVATGFLVNGAWDRGDADKEKMLSDMVDDQIDTVGKAFLGLTLGCARCHDHKFDPVSTRDYYSLAGIFYSSRIMENLGTKGGEITLKRVPLVEMEVASRRDTLAARIDVLSARLTALDKVTPSLASDHPERLMIRREIERLKAELPPPYPVAIAIQDGGMPGGLFPNIQDVPVHVRGSYTRLGAVVPRGMPGFFAGTAQSVRYQGSGRRELANWIASGRNPLTARVIVNRVWQWHFGEGLVKTPNNLGLTSEPPSHPELLDWLAATFVEEGWSLKKLHRRIVLSEAYQRSALASSDCVSRDPQNRWLARFSPRRLDAEEIRDAMLAAAGGLDSSTGGPATADLRLSRRSLYVQTARWDRGNFAALFDAANPDASVEKRSVTTVAPQALFLINHEFVGEQALGFARRLLHEAPDDWERRVRLCFQLLFGRDPIEEEHRLALRFLEQFGDRESEMAWHRFAHLMLCSNEFAYVD